AYAPSNDPDRAYFTTLLQNNLASLDGIAADNSDPLGSMFVGPVLTALPDPNVVGIWQHDYLCWVLDHAQAQGFAGGTQALLKLLRYHLAFFTTEPGYPRDYAGPYYIYAQRSDGTKFANFAALWLYNYGGSPSREQLVPFVGSYGPQARLMLLIA